MSADTPDPDRPRPAAVPPFAGPPAQATPPPGHAPDPTAPIAPAGPAGPVAPSASETPDPPYPTAWYGGPPPTWPAAPRRPRIVRAVAAALGLVVLGVPLGLLWAAVAPDTPVVKTAAGAIYGEPQPEQPIAADGWFSLLGLGFGLLAAALLWFVLRRARGPVGLVAAVLGGLGAALVAWQVGRRVGLADYERLLATAPEGRAFGKPADLRAGGVEWVLGVLPVPYGNVLLPAFGAAVAYTLLAGWSRWPSLHPEPELPGGPGVSWGSAVRPTPPAEPEPPAPGAAGPPRG
ncbi:DUF2567 domain-containing protein [Micromonospora sp. WMMA1363]|uniref:DUF2567 domain-containing protein n=1 Tax=Micromonospora sp. WMMA1363 TaxID=3053985 RepID=UPI00259CBC94|nr:DUF2567 domain-containing protein [Micromonospora sp. WMMA1363]MDM4719964.1 DUF2567 domain-containing protein [Micromonospora sp. WMMA1363]